MNKEWFDEESEWWNEKWLLIFQYYILKNWYCRPVCAENPRTDSHRNHTYEI